MKKLVKALLVALPCVALIDCAGGEPEVVCNVGRGTPFAIAYTLVSDAPAGCGTNVKATLSDFANNSDAVWGLEGYYSQTDANVMTVAVRPGEYHGLPASDDPDVPNALGSWDTLHPANNLCTVGTFQAAHATGIDTGATATSYTITGMKVLNEPAHPGTQMTANLAYTDGACTANFTVVGTWPAVPCATDDDCDPCPNNPQSANVYGSGIAADYPTTCQDGLCKLTGTQADFPIKGAAKVCK